MSIANLDRLSPQLGRPGPPTWGRGEQVWPAPVFPVRAVHSTCPASPALAPTPHAAQRRLAHGWS